MYIVNTTDRGTTRVRSGGTWQLPPELQLIIWLVWARVYPPFWLLSFLFFLPTRYVHKVVHRVTHALAKMSHEPTEHGHISLPDDAGLEVLRRRQQSMHKLGLEKGDGAG
jgi:hypothetical protein